jgi:hypothetical protein
VTTRKLIAFVIVFALALGTSVTAMAAASKLTDIGDSWAKADIEALVAKEVILGYPDNTFRPNSTVSRGEFAKMLVTALGLKPEKGVSFDDTTGHWAAPYINTLTSRDIMTPDANGDFRPNDPITRAEMITMMDRALNLGAKIEDIDLRESSFSDIDPDFWAAKSITVVDEVGLLPPTFVGKFNPNQHVTRAETAAIINAASNLVFVSGTVVETDGTGLITLKTDDGEKSIDITPNTSVYRNKSTAEPQDLVVGDKATIITDQTNTPKVVDSTGIISEKDVANKVTDVTTDIIGEILTPDQVQAIIAGDWDAVTDGFRYNLYDQLTAMGVEPWEAESLLAQDWNSLQGAAKDRLVQAIGKALAISPELALALINRDWNAAKNYGQVEVTQKLLSSLLF